MDCSPEYVNGYNEKKVGTDIVVCHSFQLGGFFHAKNVGHDVISGKTALHSDGEEKNSGKGHLLEVISSQKQILEIPNRRKELFSRGISKKNQAAMLKKKLSFQHLRWINKILRQEEKCDAERRQRQNDAVKMTDKLQQTKDLIQKMKEDISTLQQEVDEHMLMMKSKVYSNQILREDFEKYKSVFVQSARSAKEKLNQLVVELLRERNAIRRKLRCPMSGGQNKLRQEFEEIEYLRNKLEKVVKSLQCEINFLEFGHFQLSKQWF